MSAEPDDLIGFFLRKEAFFIAAALGAVGGFFQAGIGGAIAFSIIGPITYLIFAFILSIVIPLFLAIVLPILMIGIVIGAIAGAFYLLSMLIDALWGVGKPL